MTTINETRELAEQIAEHLDGWHAESPHDHSARLVNDETGAMLWLHVETYGAKRGRLVISGGTPEGASYSEGDTNGIERGEITVSPDRGSAVVAREIVRRLLPISSVGWAEMVARIERRRAALSARESRARELAEVMGSVGLAREWRGEWQADLPGSLRNGVGGKPGTYVYGHFTPDYAGEEINVEIRNLTPERARQVAELVKSWCDQ